MVYQGIFENLLRVAEVESVDYESQTCTVRMYDRVEDQVFRTCPLPQPVPGDGFGVFAHIVKGCSVLVGWGSKEKPYIVSCLPNNSFSRDVTSSSFTSNIRADSSGYPKLKSGEVAITGREGNSLLLDNTGCIKAKFGSSKFILDYTDKTLLSTNLSSTRTEASFSRSGIVLRDLRDYSTSEEADENKQTSLSHFRYLSDVSRDPYFGRVKLTNGLTKGDTEQIRNPPYVEEKRIIQEFAHSYMVGDLSQEIERTNQNEENEENFLFQPNNRTETDYDILNLNTSNPNNLIESMQGTLVDIYGNLLDINRNIIEFPSDEAGRKSVAVRLKNLSTLNRRTVKVHYEVNSKKTVDGDIAVDVLEGPDIPNGHPHSRWSVDIDGEGLTKLNIPASSNTGNIPLLSRYITNHLKNKVKTIDISKDESRPTRDILHLGFGDLKGEGIGIPEEYSPANIVEDAGLLKYRTAFHDIINTAPRALAGNNIPGQEGQGALSPDVNVEVTGSGNEFGDAVSAAENSPSPSGPGPSTPAAAPPAIQGFINNAIGEEANANAGGRSLHANLDGSLELNIGRDSVDHKSIVLDTSGGIISRIGRTKKESNSASVISQLDGHVYVQVGGDSVEGQEPVKDTKVRLVVISNDPKAKEPNKTRQDEITIDENCILIKGGNGKNIALLSEGDIVLGAKGKILLAGNTVGIHGSFDSATGEIKGAPKRLVAQKGKEI